MSFKKIFRCPYCPARDGAGLMVVDTDTVFAAGWPSNGYVELDLDAAATGSPTVVIFNPDGVPSRPCAHLISLVLDVDILRSRKGVPIRRKAAFVASWDHPWFAANDPDGWVNEFLWLELDDGIDDACDPTTPFAVCRVDQSLVKAGCRRHAIVAGTVIVAARPDIFLEELRAGEERSQTR